MVDVSVVTHCCILIKKLIQMELISVVFLLIGFSVRGVHATVPLTSPCRGGGRLSYGAVSLGAGMTPVPVFLLSSYALLLS